MLKKWTQFVPYRAFLHFLHLWCIFEEWQELKLIEKIEGDKYACKLKKVVVKPKRGDTFQENWLIRSQFDQNGVDMIKTKQLFIHSQQKAVSYHLRKVASEAQTVNSSIELMMLIDVLFEK